MKQLLILLVVLLSCLGCNFERSKVILNIESNFDLAKCTIQLEPNDSINNLVINITNLSKKTFYLSPDSFPKNSELSKEIFIIENNGKKLTYLGKEIKRRPFKRENLIKVFPGKVETTQASLNKYYNFEKNVEYNITYYSVNIQPSEISDLPRIIKIKSNTISFKTH